MSIRNGGPSRLHCFPSPIPAPHRTPPNSLPGFTCVAHIAHAGLQYGLPASWSRAEEHGLNLTRLAAAWSRAPARLAGLSKSKGVLRSGMDADMVVWDPEALADTSPHRLWHRHKLTAYTERRLRGRVLATFVRGQQVFDDERGPWQGFTCGKLLRRR